MNEKLSPEAKVVVMSTAIVAVFMIGPIVTGLIVLLALSVDQMPWPVVAVICELVVVLGSWLILWGRFKSDSLLAVDVIVNIALALLLTGLFSANAATRYNCVLIIYVTSLLLIILHSILALFVALGIAQQIKSIEAATA